MRFIIISNDGCANEDPVMEFVHAGLAGALLTGDMEAVRDWSEVGEEIELTRLDAAEAAATN